jgi:predicted lipid-binding transport protein (Tim44 family)
MGNILMIALLAMAAVFVFKLLFARKAPSQAAPYSPEPMQYAGAGNPAPAVAPAPFSSSAPAVAPATSIPAGFDAEGFVRIAKLNFVRLQAANDAKNLDDIREFVAPEMFAEIKIQMDERGNAPQQTDVVTLNAELLEVVTESSRYIASVHFSGMIRETVGAAAMPFNEVWNLTKPTEGGKGWVVAGIQQVG